MPLGQEVLVCLRNATSKSGPAGHRWKSLLPGLQPTPGARTLLTQLRHDGFALAVATSADKDDVRALLTKANVVDLIEEMASSDDAESSKPDPDILVAALQKTGEAAESAVMIGDTPYDVEAAQRAGVSIITVRCGGWGDADLKGSLATFDDPADILRHLDETPLGSYGRKH